MTQSFLSKLRKIDPYIPGEQSGDSDIIKLNANENPYPPSPKVSAALHGFNPERLPLYPDANSMNLKTAIANRFGRKTSEVFVGNGSDDVLALAFQAFFCSDEPIFFPDVTYSFYPVWCDLFRIPYRRIPLDGAFRIVPKDYAQPNGGIIFPNPNAPTGLLLSLSAIEGILAANPASVVIVDEAYIDFGGVSAVSLLDGYENLLIVQTMSKSRSLAGMRIGYALGSETLIQTLEAVKNSYNSYTMDMLALAVGCASIEDEAYFRQTCEKIIATRERTAAEFSARGYSVMESYTNFLLITHPEKSAKDIFEALRAQKIFIRYFSLPRIDNHLRITIGTDQQMNALIDAIKQL